MDTTNISQNTSHMYRNNLQLVRPSETQEHEQFIDNTQQSIIQPPVQHQEEHKSSQSGNTSLSTTHLCDSDTQGNQSFHLFNDHQKELQAGLNVTKDYAI